MTRSIAIILCLAALIGATTAQADNWPKFRGPSGNCLTEETNLPADWSAAENVAWKASIPGRGWACPVVWGKSVFIATAVEADGVYRWELYCLDVATGGVSWKQVCREGEPRTPTHGVNTYASETPVTDGERVYAYFGMHGVYCYDFNGTPVWEKDLGAFPMMNGWGTSSSPVLHDGLLLLQIDNEEQSFIVALDAETGDERWRADRDEITSWSTPLIWTNSLRTELVAGGQIVTSYDPATGDVLWTLGMAGGRSSASPTAVGDMLYVANEERTRPGRSDEGGGVLRAVKAGGSGDITPAEGETTGEFVAWSTPHCGVQMSSPLVYGGWIYILDRQGAELNCYNATTGEPAYVDMDVPDAKRFWASPWGYDGKVFAMDEDGLTHVIEPGDTLNVIDTNALGDTVWSTPAISNGALFIRGVDGVYCIKP